jgi:8-oxo-dGTP pyrophosphatase MutT (NUDIX family)
MLVVHNKHAWGLVGGGLEAGETYEECLKREIKEESNMRVLSFVPVGAQEVQFDGKIIYQLRYACIIQPYGDFVSDPDGDVSEIKLIDPKDYKQYFDWGDVGERIVERAIELKNTVLKNKKVKSFGIIPIFKDKGDYKILIVQNSKGGHWGLPKGTPEKGEKPLQTATRELFEETGLKDVKVTSDKIFSETYSFEMYGITYEKTNEYFICFVDQMTKGTDLDEIDEIRWVTFDEARKTLTNDSVIKVVDGLETYLLENE